jgi:small-conductance mechanosensitive channel
MVLLTPHDSSVLTGLVQYTRLPGDEQRKLLDSLEKPEARMVADAFLDPQKYAQAPDDVRATVDRFRAWVENNRRLRLKREARQHSSRSR